MTHHYALLIQRLLLMLSCFDLDPLNMKRPWDASFTATSQAANDPISILPIRFMSTIPNIKNVTVIGGGLMGNGIVQAR